jgi:hypothetical protein
MVFAQVGRTQLPVDAHFALVVDGEEAASEIQILLILLFPAHSPVERRQNTQADTPIVPVVRVLHVQAANQQIWLRHLGNARRKLRQQRYTLIGFFLGSGYAWSRRVLNISG